MREGRSGIDGQLDEVVPSLIEGGVFTLKGVRQNLEPASVPSRGAMSLFRQGYEEEARMLAIEAPHATAFRRTCRYMDLRLSLAQLAR